MGMSDDKIVAVDQLADLRDEEDVPLHIDKGERRNREDQVGIRRETDLCIPQPDPQQR